jgi:predicted ATPase
MVTETAMIKRLYVDNYKSLVNFELALQELTLLMGPNGAGKTSVMDVMYAIRQLLAGIAKVTDAGVFPTQTLTRWQSRPLQVFELDVALDGDMMRYRLEIEHEKAGKRARIMLETLTIGQRPLFRFEAGKVRLYRDDHSAGPEFSADWTESALARVAPGGDNTKLDRKSVV